MPYIINKYNGSELVVLQDGTLDTSTSIGLVGRNYVGYGETQNENFVFLLENFAGTNPPARAVEGQTWYDSANNKLNTYDGINWVPVGAATASENAPPGPTEGALWYKISTKQLYVYSNISGWTLVGPEGVSGFGETRIKAAILRDTNSVNHAVLLVLVNDEVLSIHSSDTFTINTLDAIIGFNELQKGVTLSTNAVISGNLSGNSTTATRLQNGRFINSAYFDGNNDITVTANTPSILTRGTYLTGSNFNGSAATTWSVDASSVNTIGKVVARDSTGSFAGGTITADQFIGPLTGNVTAISGTSTFYSLVANNIQGFTFSGLAAQASTLTPGRAINGVQFNGSQDITVTAAASTLSGSTLAAGIIDSSLTSVGTLAGVSITDAGATIGDAGEIHLFINGNSPTLAITNGLGFTISINDAFQTGDEASFEFISSSVALAAGGSADPTFVGDVSSKCNIGLPGRTFGSVYADIFNGVATSAQYADLAENYVADAEYPPGTVLEFGGEFEVTLAQDGTNRVAGVVTTNPAYLMNSNCQGTYVAAVALQGRTPCKVRGSIRKGDMLISGGNGFARTVQTPQMGTVIGKALGDFDGQEGVIEVAVGRL
jgi:hypothetical protein